MTVSAILLAAGESTRMGDLKALLPWQGRPLIAHQIAELLAAGVAEVIVVTGHAADRIAPHLPADPRVREAFNADYRTGRSASVRAGLAAIDPGAADLIILNVDQPTARGIIHRLIGAHQAAGAPISVPTRAGKRGHPPIFNRALAPEIAAIDEATEGLKRVVRTHAADLQPVEIDSPLVTLNLNRPAEYAAAVVATPDVPPGGAGRNPRP